MAGVKRQDGKESSSIQLRAEAEKKVARSAAKSALLKKQVLDKLVHELRVHQVELEMQNEELRGAQEQIAKSRNDYADLYDFSPVGYLTFNGDALITGVNLTGAALLGVERQKLLKRRFRAFVAPADAGLWDRHFVSVLQQGEKQSCDLLLRRKDGSTIHARLDSIRVETDDGTFVVRTAMSDITVQKQTEEALHKSENLYRALIEHSSDVITIIDANGTVKYQSPNYKTVWGRDPSGEIGRDLFKDIHPDDVALVSDRFNYLLLNPESVIHIEVRARHEDGSWMTIDVSGYNLLDNPAVRGIVVHFHDITERKLAEEAILRAKQLLTTVIDSTPDWMYIKDFQHKFLLVNKSFAEAQNLAPQDMIGRADTDFFSEELCLGNPDKGIRGFHADDNQALQGQMLHNPRNMVTWADGLMHIYDTYKIPLTDQFGKTYAVLVYSRDITGQTKAEEEREVSFNTLKKTLNDAINTMVKIVEMRDPYTSGHQDKVADLAIAIAREMKLGDTRIDQLRMAALIHDIGKMYIPSDILSKPGKLADIELSLIRTHAQGGYNIVNGMNFPGVVAEAVLQHHERLDGSGYPNQLKGEDIMLEAKILAVADVIEAMASHRPYRSALGIDKALEELSKNRGRLYDPGVVDTCLYLFNSGGFEFKSV